MTELSQVVAGVPFDPRPLVGVIAGDQPTFSHVQPKYTPRLYATGRAVMAVPGPAGHDGLSAHTEVVPPLAGYPEQVVTARLADLVERKAEAGDLAPDISFDVLLRNLISQGGNP